ncbi:MAG: biotin synthase BioB [Alphaproteobacteria bacterium]
MTDSTAAATDSDLDGQLQPGWVKEEVIALFALPFNDLLHKAHEVHRRHWDPNAIQLSTLVSLKTGGCGEDCKYCGQSGHYHTEVEASKIMAREQVMTAARSAKSIGATRLCMGAAWRNPRDRDLPLLEEIIGSVKAEGLETCATLGMVTPEQALRLKAAGLDYYNHNIDTSEEFYEKVITTHSFDDRLETLRSVRRAGLKVCSGGIVGMGESREDRAGMLTTLATMAPPPESIPINMLVPIPGTPLEAVDRIDTLELVRTIAVARIIMPHSRVRLSAGRKAMSDDVQALCFFAGANSIFYGERLLTADNPVEEEDRALFAKLGLKPAVVVEGAV